MKVKKMKSKNKRLSSGLQKKPKRGINVKGKWKAVELDPSLFSEEGLEGLVCFEELTDYRLVDTEKAAATEKEEVRKDKKKPKKRKAGEEENKEGESTTESTKKKARKKRKKKTVAAKESVQLDNMSTEDVTQKDSAAGEDEAASEDAAKDPAAAAEHDAQPKNAKKNKKTKKKRKKSGQQMGKDAVPEEQPDTESPSDLPPVEEEKVTKPLKKQAKNWTNAALSGSEDKNTDVSAWMNLFVPPAVLKALSSLGFGSPTPIQALALPPAIRDRMDILGAAETGSGKTLAFGIPMIHTITEWKKSPEQSADGNTQPAAQVESLYLPDVDEPTAEGDQEDNVEASGEEEKEEGEEEKEEGGGGGEEEEEEGGGGGEEREDGEEDRGSEEEEDDVEEQDEDEPLGCVQEVDNVKFNFDEKPAASGTQPLLGLVLTPTRELAVQVKHHIDAVAKFTDIKTAIVVGGMAQQKQRRMLKRRPEIIIATPGRLWELIKEKHPHLVNLRQLRCLVIDEADRMVERGHFAELESLLEMLNTTHFNPTRQTFVFSATLTMARSLPTRLLQKKKKNLDQRSKLEVLMDKVGIKAKPKIIDLTRKEATVETLIETQIHCHKEEKDFYLYYFLLQYPGRTMVFANSIDCIKRLNSLLVILGCTPLPLHANMHQKQRLKNLERFAEREK